MDKVYLYMTGIVVVAAVAIYLVISTVRGINPPAY